MLASLPGYWSLPNLRLVQKWSLTAVSLAVLAMAVWLIVEALLSFARGRAASEAFSPPEAKPARAASEALVR